MYSVVVVHLSQHFTCSRTQSFVLVIYLEKVVICDSSVPSLSSILAKPPKPNNAPKRGTKRGIRKVSGRVAMDTVVLGWDGMGWWRL